MVSFDATPTPIVLEVSSNLLRVEHMAAALPPDVPIPSIANVPEHLQENTQEMIHETVQDQEEEEHLPDSLPESEDMEEEENTAAAEEEASTARANPAWRSRARCYGPDARTASKSN